MVFELNEGELEDNQKSGGNEEEKRPGNEEACPYPTLHLLGNEQEEEEADYHSEQMD